MTDAATVQDPQAGQVPEALAEDPDLWLVPEDPAATRAGSGTTQDFLRHKERAILYGKAHAEFTLPTGKVIRIYSKSEGALERVDRAFREWFDLKVADEGEQRRRWRHWGLRRRRVERTLTDVHTAKFRMFRLIFEDPYDPAKHQELTAEDFLSMTQALEADIWRAHLEAQNVDDLIAAMFPDVDSGKKKTIRQALAPTGMWT